MDDKCELLEDRNFINFAILNKEVLAEYGKYDKGISYWVGSLLLNARTTFCK